MPPHPYQPILDAALGGLLWLVPVLLAIVALRWLFAARIKGATGERRVNKALTRLSQEVLHDIVIPDGRGGWTQLDHVALTPAGLLVIETKNYKGQIFGQPRNQKWTQRLGRQSFFFMNPLRQNYLHIQALKALAPGVPVHGRVVFAGVARFLNGVPEGVSTLRTFREDLKHLFQESAADADLQQAWRKVKEAARTDRATRKAHLAGVRAKHGPELRRPVALGLLTLAGLWVVLMLLIKGEP